MTTLISNCTEDLIANDQICCQKWKGLIYIVQPADKHAWMFYELYVT